MGHSSLCSVGARALLRVLGKLCIRIKPVVRVQVVSFEW